MSADDYKRQAAAAALDLIEDGMKIGLGSGSTAQKFVELLAARVDEGLDVVCVPTSETTRLQAVTLGLKLATLDDVPFLDLTVDGADEIDNDLRLIKGGGGALLREKIVATSSERMVVIADVGKHVRELGAFALPLEVVAFGLNATRNMISALASDCGCEGELTVRLGRDGKPFITDNGNLIIDCAFGSIPDPEGLDEALKLIPGVVENGLFIAIADKAFIAGPAGITVLDAEDAAEYIDV